MHVSIVPTHEVHVVAQEVTEHLRGVERYTSGRYHAEDMVRECAEGKQAMFIAFTDDLEIKGVLVARIVDYPRKAYSRITFMGGKNLSEWKDQMYELIQKWGVGMGAEGQEWLGRAGWVKLFPDMTPTLVFMEKDFG